MLQYKALNAAYLRRHGMTLEVVCEAREADPIELSPSPGGGVGAGGGPGGGGGGAAEAGGGR